MRSMAGGGRVSWDRMGRPPLRRSTTKYPWFWILTPLMVVVIIVLVVVGYQQYTAWARWCTAQGGMVNSHTDWVTTYDREGGSHMNSNTTYYCIRDGQTIGIR